MPGRVELCQVYPCLGIAAEGQVGVPVIPGCAMTGKAGDSSINRAPPDRIGTVRMALCTGTDLGKGTIAAAILEDNVFGFVDMIGRIYVTLFFHVTLRKILVMTACTRTVNNRSRMTIIAGKLSLTVTGMGVCPGSTGSGIRKHRHCCHPFLADWPTGFYCPLLAVLIDTIIMAVSVRATTDGMTMAGIAFSLGFCPGKGFNLLRIGCAVAVTINVITCLCLRNVTCSRAPDNIPLGRHGNILCAVDMLRQISDFSVCIYRIIVAVVTGILPDPLGSDQSVMTV